ncbi:Gfo/Idh/MocA family oxidoreductase [[Enterobacter] lignolyticus]|uniref:Oxidoreductase n=1 Tax=[Enterobacter] lignolyticus TaxID=1334193 RepID=A0A806XAV5_9ENTR|nr:Gfo/Idh/MocA family oxidoreductase [[Enterobacter] lignolyticus]ALR78122.1 oxidoreductase [[Enterobacter] lignolyticus]
MSKTVKIGIVGLGRIGKNHARNLARRVRGAELIAGSSPVAAEREWAKTELGITRLYENMESLLADKEIDAVWLATPTSLHASQIVSALEAGKHVFCEKPLALAEKECERVLEAAEQYSSQTVMIGFMRRYDPAYVEAKRLLNQGELGRLFRLHCASLDAIDTNGFFVDFAPTSGGLFLDCSIHDIDVALWMTNGAKPVSVSATGIRAMYPGLAACNDVDTATATVLFENDILATFHASRTSHHGDETSLQLVGTESSLSLGVGGTPTSEVNIQKGNANHCHQVVDFFGRFEQAFALEAQAFVDAVVNGDTLRERLLEAQAATRIGVAMRIALEQQKIIHFDS